MHYLQQQIGLLSSARFAKAFCRALQVSCGQHLWCADIKAGTHQADFKELAATKANGVVASRRQRRTKKAALEHTAQTTADGKLTCAFCACVRGINCLFQQLSIVYSSFKRRNRNKDIQDKRRYMKRKQSSACLPFWISVTLITLKGSYNATCTFTSCLSWNVCWQCVHNHPIMIKIHPVFFVILLNVFPFLKSSRMPMWRHTDGGPSHNCWLTVAF